MRVSRASSTTNPAGGLKIIESDTRTGYERKDFFRDLKKASKKQNQPSQRDQEKR